MLAVSCNYKEGTSAVRQGAKAYYLGGRNGDGFERRRFIVRSRSGRWIIKWERTDRLENWRPATVVPEQGFLFDQLTSNMAPTWDRFVEAKEKRLLQ